MVAAMEVVASVVAAATALLVVAVAAAAAVAVIILMRSEYKKYEAVRNVRDQHGILRCSSDRVSETPGFCGSKGGLWFQLASNRNGCLQQFPLSSLSSAIKTGHSTAVLGILWSVAYRRSGDYLHGPLAAWKHSEFDFRDHYRINSASRGLVTTPYSRAVWMVGQRKSK